MKLQILSFICVFIFFFSVDGRAVSKNLYILKNGEIFKNGHAITQTQGTITNFTWTNKLQKLVYVSTQQDKKFSMWILDLKTNKKIQAGGDTKSIISAPCCQIVNPGEAQRTTTGDPIFSNNGVWDKNNKLQVLMGEKDEPSAINCLLDLNKNELTCDV